MHRPATLHDLPALQQIERAAGEAFRALGMAAVADDEPVTSAEFAALLSRGEAWVALADDGRPCAYLLVEQVDDALHVEQLSVDPRHARRGLGAALLGLADGRAAALGLAALTLTTFAEVPWNAPYYRRLGFAVVAPTAQGPALRRRVAEEAGHGLAEWPRVVMRRPLG